MSDPAEELSKEAISTAIEVFSEPFVKPLRDILGGFIVDRIEVWRRGQPAWQKLNQRQTLLEAAEDSRGRGIREPSRDTKPEHIAEVFEAAAERSSPEIRTLFARLLRAAMDPNRARFYRSEFVEIVEKLEPLDAQLLSLCGDPSMWHDDWQNKVAQKLVRYERDEIELAGMNLERAWDALPYPQQPNIWCRQPCQHPWQDNSCK
jgi:hypothetical protein